MQFSDIDTIFAYCGINHRQKLSLISRQSDCFCHTHQYITSLPTDDINLLLDMASIISDTDLTLHCLKSVHLTINIDKLWNPFLIWVMEGNLDIIRRFLIDPRFDPGFGNHLMSIPSAIENNHPKVIKLFLEDGRMSNAITNSHKAILQTYLRREKLMI